LGVNGECERGDEEERRAARMAVGHPRV